MCRWMAWLGQPVLIEELLFKTQHGIVDQSLHSRMGAEPTNGDGFGLGWYGAGEGPGSTTASRRPGATRTCASSPATSSRRCSSRTCARRSARPCRRPTATRSATATGCSCTTGTSAACTTVRRDLMLAIDPELFADVHGSTDTEVVFHLALTFGLERGSDRRARAHGRPDRGGRRAARRSPTPSRARSASPTASTLWAVRYATQGPARSLFASADVDAIQRLHPDNPRFAAHERGGPR